MFNFDWLIYPFDKKEFFENIWQKRPTIISKNRNSYFKEFFSGSQLDVLIEYGQPKPPSIRLASKTTKEKTEVPFNSSGRLDTEKLRKCYLNGQTIVINNVEDFDPNIAVLTQSMQAELDYRIQVNSYLTPAQSQGFNAHYDTHDVLVAQIEGEKLWSIYASDCVCPLNEMVDGDPNPLRERSTTLPEEIRLKSGDLLYIPRGWIHEAETSDIASLHLTVGIHPPLGHDMLTATLEYMVRLYPEFRAPLPPSFTQSEEYIPEVEEMFTKLMKIFCDNASAQNTVRIIGDELSKRVRSGGDGHLFCDINKLNLDSLLPESKIERRLNVPLRLVDTEQGVGLQFLNKLVQGPIEFVPAFHYIMKTNKPFRVMDFPGLELDHQLALATSLIINGLCRFENRTWQ